MKEINERIVCKDGFSISVQGSQYAYCTPRTDVGPYDSVECGFPSSKPVTPKLLEYAELCGTDDYCETVYGYVPVEVVLEELEAHGGIVSGELPK